MVEDPWQRLLQPRGSARCNTYMNSKREKKNQINQSGFVNGEFLERGELKVGFGFMMGTLRERLEEKSKVQSRK